MVEIQIFICSPVRATTLKMSHSSHCRQQEGLVAATDPYLMCV